MNRKSKKILKRVVALFLVMAMFFLLPANGMTGQMAQAASSKKLYIGEVKLFIKAGGSESDAKKWCDAQEANKDKDDTNDWEVVPGNLNEGASGALKKEVAVYMCYQKTADADEAVTDLAVMNEKGNYSEGAYEQILKDQRDTFKDMINDMQEMLVEYRENYKNQVPTAVQAHDFMNTYIEDDSGELLGDLLLTISDDDLVEVFLQANGQVVLMMQEQLAYACDTKRTTWLDRMEKLGTVKKSGSDEYMDGYEALRERYLKAYKKNAAKADAELKEAYHDKALKILAAWEDVRQHFDKVKKFYDQNGIADMSDEEYIKQLEAWTGEVENGKLNTDVYVYAQEQQTLSSLMLYRYGSETLLNYFSQSYEDVSGVNIYKLYPLAASLTDGQIAAINGSVSLYEVLTDALSATALNDTGKGKAAELTAKMTDEDQQELEEVKEELQTNIEEYQKLEPTSVYEGVDRGVYEGGVAVTSAAENYSSGAESNWADGFVDSGAFTGASISMGAGSLLCAGGAVAFNIIRLRIAANPESFAELAKSFEGIANGTITGVSKATKELVKEFADEGYKSFMSSKTSWQTLAKASNADAQFLQNAKEFQKATEEMWSYTRSGMRYKIMQRLKIGFTVACIVLAVADIVMTVITLYKYYNKEHLPIPNYMVDLSYNDAKDTSYINYKSVQDTDGKNGDMNGGGGKQWLALYATKDKNAGNPILAPDGDSHPIIVQKKSDKTPGNYSPLHMFGKPNAPQNLTFADGENGWSYNDKEGGIYLFFERDTYSVSSGDDGVYASAITGGNMALASGIGALVGLIIGLFAMALIGRRKKVTHE